jgi:hypothetical protein
MIEATEYGEEPKKKSIGELSGAEMIVYGVLTEEGYTLEGIKEEVGEKLEYIKILDALKVLLDSELVAAITRGEHTIYKRVEES